MGCGGSRVEPAAEIDDLQRQRDAIAAAAAAAAEARQQDEKDEDCFAWKEYDSAKLEAALTKDEELGDSAVRLLDARFIVELDKRGGRLVRRQDLPDAAFLSLEEVKRLPTGGKYGDCLRAGDARSAADAAMLAAASAAATAEV